MNPLPSLQTDTSLPPDGVFYVARNGVEIGRFNEAILKDSFVKGILSPDDDVFCTGMAGWVKLGTIIQSEAPETARRYYYLDHSKVNRGPLSIDLLCSQIEDGRIPPDALICMEGENEWMPANELHDFRATLETIRAKKYDELFESEEKRKLRKSPNSNLAGLIEFVLGLFLLVWFFGFGPAKCSSSESYPSYEQSRDTKYYQKEIKDGLDVLHPGRNLSAEEERRLHIIAEETARQYPRSQ